MAKLTKLKINGDSFEVPSRTSQLENDSGFVSGGSLTIYQGGEYKGAFSVDGTYQEIYLDSGGGGGEVPGEGYVNIYQGGVYKGSINVNQNYDSEIYLDSGGAGGTVDSEMSLESENPVQNKVITQALKDSVQYINSLEESWYDYKDGVNYMIYDDVGEFTNITNINPKKVILTEPEYSGAFSFELEPSVYDSTINDGFIDLKNSVEEITGGNVICHPYNRGIRDGKSHINVSFSSAIEVDEKISYTIPLKFGLTSDEIKVILLNDIPTVTLEQFMDAMSGRRWYDMDNGTTRHRFYDYQGEYTWFDCHTRDYRYEDLNGIRPVSIDNQEGNRIEATFSDGSHGSFILDIDSIKIISGQLEKQISEGLKIYTFLVSNF